MARAKLMPSLLVALLSLGATVTLQVSGNTLDCQGATNYGTFCDLLADDGYCAPSSTSHTTMYQWCRKACCDKETTCNLGSPVNKGTLNENGEHEIDESSGLAYSRNIPGVLWTFNDSGGKARIFAISEEGRRLRSVQLRGAKNRDWEDMAVAKEGGTSYIYVGDIGDNSRKRGYLTIYKFPEPTTLGGSSFSINEDEIEKIRVKYPGKKYDCEALVVDPDTLDIILLAKRGSGSRVFVLPHTNGPSSRVRPMEEIGKMNNVDLVTGADISPDGKTMVVVSYGRKDNQKSYMFNKPSDQTWRQYLASDPAPCKELDLASEDKREAVAVTNTAVWTTSECRRGCPLWYYARN